MSKLNFLINLYKSVIITREECGFCVKAINEFKKIGTPVYVVKYEDNDKNTMDLIFKEIYSNYRHNTFPMIFIDGQFIGGYDSLKKYIKRNYEQENNNYCDNNQYCMANY